MTNIQTIPLNQLVPSPANVRKTGAAVGIDELAASIAAHGLLQNLQVRPGAKGKFEVVAGGRRLAALKLLAKQKALPKDAEIPCHVLDGEDAGEISLAENTLRLPMHPADQYDAFKALADGGKGPEEIAARFGTTASVVRQRLKLASVSPCLVDLYRHDEMTLDQLMAFTVSDDHEAQEAAWFGQPDYNRSPQVIRRTLTAAHVEADDPRVAFAGLDAYRDAGGGILRDLFQPEHEGYLTDPALLDRLVAERLEREAESIRAEGWKWVEIMPRLDYAALRGFARLHPERQPLPPAQQEELDRLVAEYEGLIADHGEDPEDEIAARLDALSGRIDSLSEGTLAWREDDIAMAGAVIGIRHDGGLAVERGLLRPEDAKASADEPGNEGEKVTGAVADAPRVPGLSASLIEDLTAQRTAALRAMLEDNPAIALASVAHALALPLFYGHAYGVESCLDIRSNDRDLRASAGGIGESGAAVLLAARRAAWEQRLPSEPAALFGWLLTQNAETVTGLVAFCAAMSIDAVQSKQDRAGCARLAHADELAAALGLDMALWWKPTKASYLGRVSKALILDAVREGVSPSAAENLAGLKKDALVARAEERLAGKDWLPEILRPPVAPQPDAAASEIDAPEPDAEIEALAAE